MISRRGLLASAAALSGAAALSAALPGRALAATRLRVGYIPIIPMTQLFVLSGEGWARQAGLELETTSFQSGPAMVQALASGTLDVAYVGIGPAMVARSKGIPLKIVAANVVDQVALIGRGALASAAASAPTAAQAFAEFRRTQGRPAKIATLPAGSVPDTVLRYWVRERAGIPAEHIEIVGMGEQQVQQGLLAGAVDGASILEPILTIVRSRLPDARIVAAAGDLFPGQPGAILAVTEQTIARDRDAVTELVRLHVRATRFAREEPDRTAAHVAAFIGQGLIEPALLREALTSGATTFTEDPRAIMEPTRSMQAFQQTLGQLANPVEVDSLFDLSFYDAVTKG
ncbi:ABC transporter substrate-binding protein [Azospirillum sp. SYSU D00513]|uniref:ABC transporter substrate-binding protein n=1 Tax=Azospirillum sp. SYSU D00513 TaxID=2812561 RepID=UPI0020001A1D|nr:ABC transporter substrate-binding protein [Azospirillum sp. SYSU D00513]